MGGGDWGWKLGVVGIGGGYQGGRGGLLNKNHFKSSKKHVMILPGTVTYLCHETHMVRLPKFVGKRFCS